MKTKIQNRYLSDFATDEMEINFQVLAICKSSKKNQIFSLINNRTFYSN